MGKDINEKIDAIARGFEEFKEANDQRLARLEKIGAVDPTIQSKVDKANEDIQKMTDERDKMAQEIKALRATVSRPGFNGEGKDRDKEIRKEQLHRKALVNFLKGYNHNCLDDNEMKEFKAIGGEVDIDPQGGYLVRPELATRIVEKIFETSNMRAIASVTTIGSDALEGLANLDLATVGWVAERAARTQTNIPQWKAYRIPVNELYSEPGLTLKMLDDANFDIESYLAMKVAQNMSLFENTAFITGNGVGKPRGITTYGNDTSNPDDINAPWGSVQQIHSGNANLLTADGLIALFYYLKEPYQKNASFVMQRLAVLAVRQLKDGFGRYLWEPSLTAGNPDMLFGRPVYQFADMAAVAAGNLPVACGDFSQAYQIVDRAGIRVLRDPFTSKPNVLYYTTKRTGGDIINFEALKLQVVGVGTP